MKSYSELKTEITRKRLTLKATDNHENQFNVDITLSRYDDNDPEWSLDINKTPGKWYMKTLTHDHVPFKDSVIAIDMGQNWLCTNINELLTEAENMIEDEKNQTHLAMCEEYYNTH